jgi:hypothetical protein
MKEINKSVAHKVKFNFRKVQLFLSFMKAFKQNKKHQSNVRFDELMLAAKAKLYDLEKKGLAKLSYMWTIPEDQILLDCLAKNLNFATIAFKINEHNQITCDPTIGKI